MVDISAKFRQVLALIERGKYFTINRPRQFGKTTMLFALGRRLADGYLIVRLSFEGVDDAMFADGRAFSEGLVELIARSLDRRAPESATLVRKLADGVDDLDSLSSFITRFVASADRDVMLLIDEVDKSSNSQVFLGFLGLLREKYLLREEGEDTTFRSVVLAGVHDVKSLKLKIREGGETKLNSPWNIAADFNVDMSFSSDEIGTMLVDFAGETGVQVELAPVAERLHYYTSGHPFLVSKLCKIIDEEAAVQNPDHDSHHWTVADVDWAFGWLTREDYTTTNFDDLAKNVENSPELYALAYSVLFGGNEQGVPFSLLDPVVSLASQYGILRANAGRAAIHNRVYEQILANYMRSRKLTRDGGYPITGVLDDYTVGDRLDLRKVLLKFQAFMKEHYSDHEATFLEREGRLVFLSFLKPIINGLGFAWKEPVTGPERRMDLVVTFGNAQKEVVELKIWRGPKYHQQGLEQLCGYLDFQGLSSGYLLIFDLSRDKQYKSEDIRLESRDVFAVWV